MNFNAVREANGAKVVMSAIATSIDGTTHIPSGTPKQNCKFTDANGEQQSVTIWQGKGIPIPTEKQGLTLSINISCKAGNNNRMNYGGFWSSTAQVQQQPQQGPSQPAGTSKSEKIDWDAIAEGKCRHGLVCAYIESGREPDINVIKKWLKYIMKGEESPNLLPRDIVYSEPDNEPQPEDDEPLPF